MIRQLIPYLLLVTAANIPPNMKALIHSQQNKLLQVA